MRGIRIDDDFLLILDEDGHGFKLRSFGFFLVELFSGIILASPPFILLLLFPSGDKVIWIIGSSLFLISPGYLFWLLYKRRKNYLEYKKITF